MMLKIVKTFEKSYKKIGFSKNKKFNSLIIKVSLRLIEMITAEIDNKSFVFGFKLYLSS